MTTLSPGKTANPKDRQVRLSDLVIGDPTYLDMWEITPSSVNEEIYRPVDPRDPSIHELAESIKDHGLLDPIVVTREGWILSGHRRYAACSVLGMRSVECRIAEISRHDPEFVEILCEFNRQRVKSFDEVIRECVVSNGDGDAYESLIAHRKAQSAVSGEFLRIEGRKTRKSVSRNKRPMLDAVIKAVQAKRKYWPTSDRSIHYKLLNDPPLRYATRPDSRYRNDRPSYQDLCDILTRGRLAGSIPFHALRDPTRTIQRWDIHRNIGPFVKRELDCFLADYRRDLQQSQPNHIEIVGEKNTVEGSIRPVAGRFCIPYTLGRGYCSLDPRYKMSERFRASGKDKLIVLVLSDFDPEGEDIAHSFARSMRDDFGISRVVARKVCLTHQQVLDRQLPENFDAKVGSSRYKKFAARYGDSVYELEALPEEELSELLTDAIDEVLDIDAFNAELDAEREDAEKIEILREKVGPLLIAALNEKSEGPS